MIHARSPGSTWIVGSVVESGGAIADSIQIDVGCTLELQVKLTPTADTLAVGASFSPAIELLSCGGQVQLSDTIRWSAGDTSLIRVDSVSGLTTGLRAGQTSVVPRGTLYHLPGGTGIPFTVVNAP